MQCEAKTKKKKKDNHHKLSQFLDLSRNAINHLVIQHCESVWLFMMEYLAFEEPN